MSSNTRQLRRVARYHLIALAALAACGGAGAFDFETGNPDVRIRWDNTVKYSNAFRLKDRAPGLSSTRFGPTGVVGPNNINQDDGNNNFSKGLVSNRLDVLSELDVLGPRWGARVSAAAWYDTVYNRSTDNTTTTSNHTPASEFAGETRELMGRNAEILDAFVFTKFDLGEKPATVRLGRHTLLWGESLFFGANGIAGGQAPLDLVKLLSVPNSQFKEIARPTGKVSAQVQLSSDVSVAGYVGYEWEKTRLMPVGAYLSGSDTLGPGSERLNAGPTGVFARGLDLEPPDSGQGGVQLRWRVDAIDTDLGFYAIRYHATTPSNIYTTLNGRPPALSGNNFRWAYHEGVRAFGASFSKSVNEWGLAGEVSIRKNAPLASSGQSVIPAIGVGTTFDNDKNPGYAVGETAHAQFSWLASLGPSFISREASFLGEIAWNRRLKVTKNPGMLNPNADRDATAMRLVYAPTYRQIVPGLDLTPSIGMGYTWGKSSAVGPGFGADKGGDINIGLSGVYLGRWTAALNYVHYLGTEGPTLDNANNAQYRQALKDRNFITFSLRTTF
ncbi:DUF1302 domain-containing protein [Caenimonas sedimenti]|uniref:DUF1302 domain-containing protein n=1 Tax=Caenimonas sedimenti TaxID=2596921 RepID=A0A562ZX85_9BURK|nr:DUF1302 domain-containing protein [Caenimonas sedimenti]TWO72905.1 DUF1302 domain-containing protein [Caenimonas sedimenti]